MSTKSDKKLTSSLLEKELLAIMEDPNFDLESETQKTLRQRISDRLHLEEFPKDKRSVLKDLVVRIINEKVKSQSESEGASSEEDEESPRVSKRKSAPKSTSTTAYGEDVKALLDLGKALRMGPRLYQGLKDMKDDTKRIETLTERLKGAGAKWKGKLPSHHDISQAKKEKAKQDDLEGLDTSLIIEDGGGRRGRARRARVNYNVDQEEQRANDSDDAGAKESPQKKTKTSRGQDESADEEFDGDDDDSEPE